MPKRLSCVSSFILLLGALFAPRPAAAAPPILWEYPNFKVAVIMADFPDRPARTWTKADVAANVFTDWNSAANFWHTVSGGRVTITGDVYDDGGERYAIPRPDQPDGTCDWATYFSDAVAAADADVDFAAYNTVFVVAPRIECSTGGKMSNVVIPGSSYRYLAAGSDGMLGIIPHHELGHVIGLDHANSWECTPAATLVGTCREESYGDRYSVMGLAMARMMWPAAPHLENMGWLDAGDLQEVTADGDYVIRAVESAGSQPRYLKIPQARDADGKANSWYYLEYRQDTGFDHIEKTPTVSELGVTDGALVHLGADSTRERFITTRLLDMTPGEGEAGWDIFKPALRVGASYTDPAAGVSFGILSRTSATLTVRVKFGGATLCERKAPTITTKAVKNSGRPGQRLRYRVTLTNNDVLCGSQRFELRTAKKPSGWTVKSNGKSTGTTSLRPGQRKVFDVRLTTPAGAALRKYAVTLEGRHASPASLQQRKTVKPTLVR